MINLCSSCVNNCFCEESARPGECVTSCYKYKSKTADVTSDVTSDVITDGYKHDGGKLRLDLVPAELIEAVGTVMTHGAEKYGEGNYRKVEPKRYRAALMRHICKWLNNPFGKDADSGLPHIWHIACNVAFLIVLDKEK